ncbi:PucR family transcriptional regulator [Alkalicoccus luteus]|uniref:PucR family transcriptional regulator n=1 Tax=Alkalicoccus luteus TaxID=1237094 RepID=UPI004033CA88
MTNHPFHRAFDTLEEFVDAVSAHLEVPVTLEDANHHLLAYSSHHDSTDEARIRTIISRRVPEKVINRFWKEGIIPRLNQQDEPVIIDPIDTIGLGRRVAVSIRRRGEVLGYIWVIDQERRLDKTALEELQLAASKAKNQLLQLNRQKQRREQSHEELFWQLLTGEAGSHDDVCRLLEQASIRTQTPLAVAALYADGLNNDSYRRLTYALQTTQQVDIVVHTQDEQHVYVLIRPKTNDYARDAASFAASLQERIQGEVALFTGIGSFTEDFSRLPASLEEAVNVASMKARFPDELADAWFYHELGVFRYVDILEQSGLLPGLKENPALSRLKQYDAEHDSHMLETLSVYLEEDGSMTQAAARLHCHINTLTYRLKRIQDISGVDLKNPIQKLGLYMDVKLLTDVR